MQAIVQDRYGSAEVLEARDIDKPRDRGHATSWSASTRHRSTSVTGSS